MNPEPTTEPAAATTAVNPNAEELKRVHGADVELAPDDSKDEHLSETDALARAREEGIEFVDEFVVALKGSLGAEVHNVSSTHAEAEAVLMELPDKDNYEIFQRRHQKSQ